MKKVVDMTRQSTVTCELNAYIPMRDGVRLAANIWHYDKPMPTIITRIFYGKDGYPNTAMCVNFQNVIQSGYNYIRCDCRGAFNSEGGDPLIAHDFEKDDAQDMFDRIAAQPWSDGNIGIEGGSYHGYTTWSAVSTGHKNLKAAVVYLSLKRLYGGSPWYTTGGGLMEHMMRLWAAQMATQQVNRMWQRAETPEEKAECERLYNSIVPVNGRLYSKDPLTEYESIEKVFPCFRDWMDHPDLDDYWQKRNIHEEDVKIPVLQYMGWYDVLRDSMMNSYVRTKEAGGSEDARTKQILVIGPWNHCDTNYTGAYNTMSFGNAAGLKTLSTNTPGTEKEKCCCPQILNMKFYDRYLKGDEHALDDVAPVNIFVMGINKWREEQAWPLPDTKWTDVYLTSGGNANSSSGNGILKFANESDAEKDCFTYDPHNPVGTMGGTIALPANVNGPQDRQELEKRQDILCFTTPELKKAVEVTGPISLQASVSITTPDSDICATIVDVYPDGRAIHITEGMLRLRYRNSLSKPELLIPGEIYNVTVDLGCTSNVFMPGHRIRLEVTGSNHPAVNRNSNTGHAKIVCDKEEDMVSCDTTIYHSELNVSKLILPIIEREGTYQDESKESSFVADSWVN